MDSDIIRGSNFVVGLSYAAGIVDEASRFDVGLEYGLRRLEATENTNKGVDC